MQANPSRVINLSNKKSKSGRELQASEPRTYQKQIIWRLRSNIWGSVAKTIYK